MKPSEHPEPNGHDPLEERLRRITFRPADPAWRDEILSAADAAARPQRRMVTSAESATVLQRLAAWLRGIPTEWSAAAALWMLILAINSISSSSSGSANPAGLSSVSIASVDQQEESIKQALALRRQLLSELQGQDQVVGFPNPARPEADRPKRQLNFFGTNGIAAASA